MNASSAFTLGDNIERLVLTGTGNIVGNGNELANIITGNEGNNRLDGGLGSDKLAGGAGMDKFVFDSALGATNIDRITDFSVVDDTVLLDQTIFSALSATGPLAGTAFWTGGGAHDADDRIIYNPATGALLYDSDGVGGDAAIRFAQLATGLALTHADFLIIV